MFERETTDADDDIEFEFFDDPPTREATQTELGQISDAAPPPTPPRRSVRVRRPSGGSHGVRLALLAGAIVLLVVIIVLAIRAFSGGKESEFSNYMDEAGAIAEASATIGQEANEALVARGPLPSELQSQLDGFRGRQAQLVQRALDVDAPGDLTEAHEGFVESMQLRVSGLGGLSQAFEQLAEADSDQAAGLLLAEQSNRLIASDVIYADLFVAPARRVLAQENVTGVAVPESVFVRNLEFYSPSSMTFLVQNFGQVGDQGAPGGILRGNSLVSVVVQPDDLQLAPRELNDLFASSDLGFDVLVRNSGDHQETNVEVKLILQQPGQPIRKSQTIDVINPDEERIVSFRDFGAIEFATQLNLRITITPVPGEANLDNNSAEYPIFISLE